MLVDTGASVTIISCQFYQTLKGNEEPQINLVPIKLVSASRNPISVQGGFIELLIEKTLKQLKKSLWPISILHVF